MKGDAGGPLRSALTLTIKEHTISVKHVFSAFTLYANVLRRVKVPFDEAQQEFIRKSIHWNLSKKRPKDYAFRLKVDFQRFLSGKEMLFPRDGSFKSTGGILLTHHFKLSGRTQGYRRKRESSWYRNIHKLKLMCQHTDGKRREHCIDNKTLQRKDSHAVVSNIPQIFQQTT